MLLVSTLQITKCHGYKTAGGSSDWELDRSWLSLCGKLFIKPSLVVMPPDSGKSVLMVKYDGDHTTSRSSALTAAAVQKYGYTEPTDETPPLLVDGRSTRPIRNAELTQLKLCRRQFSSTLNPFRRIRA